jgi:hypothetical protein
MRPSLHPRARRTAGPVSRRCAPAARVKRWRRQSARCPLAASVKSWRHRQRARPPGLPVGRSSNGSASQARRRRARSAPGARYRSGSLRHGCSTSRERPARLHSSENRTLNRGDVTDLLVQAESRGLSALLVCAFHHDRRFQSARGASLVKRRALRSRPTRPAGQSASSAPLRFPGRCGGISPLEGVAGDSVAAPAQGKAFPFG